MIYLILFIGLFSYQDPGIPYLPEEDFSYEMEYFLKKKPAQEAKAYETEKRSYAAVLPYIKLHFSIDKFEPEDKRIKVYRDGLVFLSKKIKGPIKLSIDMGYAVDMKEGVTPSSYTIFIYSDSNEPRAKIDIKVKPSGELLINDQTSGMI